jgi:alpha-glucosidase
MKVKDGFGEAIALDAAAYTILRDDYDNKFFTEVVTNPSPIDELIKADTLKNRITFFFEHEKLTIEAIGHNLIKITWRDCALDTMLEKFKAIQSDISLEKKPFGYKIHFNDLIVEIYRSGGIKFYSGDELLREEFPPIFTGKSVACQSRIRSNSFIYSLGEKSQGLNLRGKKSVLWNHDADGKYGPGDDPLYLAIPLLVDIVGSRGYFIFYNNPSRGEVDICSSSKDVVKFNFSSCGLEYYVGIGSLPDLIEKYCIITGRPFLPPRWSLGFHQSRYSYKSCDEIEKLADGFIKNKLQLSCIHMDIDYMEGFKIFTFNKSGFNQISELNKKLKVNGIRTTAIVDPAVKMQPGYTLFDEGLKEGHFVKYPDGNVLYAPVWAGLSAFPDFTDAGARSWWGGKYSFLLDKGISGIWHDMNEPVAFTISGDNSLPKCAIFKAGLHVETHNLYGLLMAKACYDALIAYDNISRPFILSRSGWAGIQKYAFVWTGDTESTWEEMHSSIATVLNLGLSGIPYAGVDTGGFAGEPGNELFLRWFQMSTFFPFFRVHSAKEGREPWSYGQDYLEIIREFLNVRYSLIPYIYDLCFEAHLYGRPILRPAFWDDVDYDHDEYSVFMLGSDVFVAPVHSKGQTRIEFKLPEGKWFSFWDDSLWSGNVGMDVTIERIPVFVKSGSILPMKREELIEFNIYLAEDGANGNFYKDDGTQSSLYLKYNFKVEKREDYWLLSFDANFNGIEKSGIMRFRVHGITLTRVSDGCLLYASMNAFDMPETISSASFS